MLTESPLVMAPIFHELNLYVVFFFVLLYAQAIFIDHDSEYFEFRSLTNLKSQTVSIQFLTGCGLLSQKQSVAIDKMVFASV